MSQSPEERLMQAEQQIRVLASMVSGQGGELKALHDVVQGFMTFAGRIPEVRAQVELNLEKSAANNLGASTNQTFVDKFDAVAGLVRGAMDSLKDDNSAPNNQRD